MSRPTLCLATAAALVAAITAGGHSATAQERAAAPGARVQFAQDGDDGPPPSYGPPYRRPYYGRGYGPPPYGIVPPGTVRLRLLARGYYGIRGVRYVPHGPGRFRAGPGARLPGHYVVFARRLGAVYRFHSNPYTGRPYIRVRIH